MCGPFQPLSETRDPEACLRKLKDIRTRRMSQPANSAYRMETSCARIPHELDKNFEYGYHRECYQRFTMNLHRLSPSVDPQPSTSKPKRRPSSDQVLFAPDCIFCNSEKRKKVKLKGTWTTEGLFAFEFDGWKTVLNRAEEDHDERLLRRIRGHDLFACEAKFHRSCRSKYTQNPQKWRSENEGNRTAQQELEKVHHDAFTLVRDMVDREILKGQAILKLTDLCEHYINHLKDTDYHNLDYRSSKLKLKLEKHYGVQIAFCSLGKYKTHLVYNRNIDVNTAIQHAYELGSRDIISDSATLLNQVIIHHTEYNCV